MGEQAAVAAQGQVVQSEVEDQVAETQAEVERQAADERLQASTAAEVQSESSATIEDILSFKPMPLADLDKVVFGGPLRQLLSTEVMGLDHVPTDYPCLYVMNHALLGIEVPSFVHLLYKEKGFFVRGLGDHFHFHWAAPHKELFRKMGVVDGTRANVDLLMEDRQNVLVYPGGGAEICKNSEVERYALIWKERLGFARAAIKNKYSIMPCAAVGTEDMLDIVLDVPAPFLPKSIESVPMVAPNSLQKVYFWFGEPISTEQYCGDADNTEFATEVRDRTKAAIEAGIKELQGRQATDPERFLRGRVEKQIQEKTKEMTEKLVEAVAPQGSLRSQLMAAAVAVSGRACT